MTDVPPRRTSNLSSPPWTPAEERVLRRHYLAKGAQACADRLPGRTKHAVKKRAASLGLRKVPVLDTPELTKLQRICERADAAAFDRFAQAHGMRTANLRQVATQHGWEWPGKVAARPWSAADDQQLAELYKTLSRDACAAQLQRNPDHVKRRIRELGLSKRERAWTSEDDQRLRALYGSHTPAECAALLDRTKGAVLTRAHGLGLTNKPAPRTDGRRAARPLRRATVRWPK
jgi:hypothetical protein